MGMDFDTDVYGPSLLLVPFYSFNVPAAPVSFTSPLARGGHRASPLLLQLCKSNGEPRGQVLSIALAASY